MRHLLIEKSYDKNPKRWFKSLLKSVEELSPHPDYKNIVFYKLGDEIIFEYNEKNGDFWIIKSTIWSVFIKKFKLNYNEIQLLTKVILEEHYKLKELIPKKSLILSCLPLKEHYKLKELTPIFV